MEKILDGKKCAESLYHQLKGGPNPPRLAVILVGDDPASQVYVSHKEKACKRLGFGSIVHRLPSTATQGEVRELLEQLNQDEQVDGILVQLPLPSHCNQAVIISAINPDKDVDGLTPVNQGKLYQGQEAFTPCTPLGILTLLDFYQVDLLGKRAVVIGRSQLVGRPIAYLLDQRGATVTTVHSQTVHPWEITQQADVLVVAAGKPQLVASHWVKPGAVVIDVGIHRVDGKIVGDVDFHGVLPVCAAISPVPGGVGPMTIAALMGNTHRSWQKKQRSLKRSGATVTTGVADEIFHNELS